MTESTKTRYISSESAILKKNYTHVNEKEKTIVENLIQECAFMKVSLKEMKDDMNKNGVIQSRKNGNGIMTQTDIINKNYNTMMKTYLNALKQLKEFLPKDLDVKEDEEDELMQFQKDNE